MKKSMFYVNAHTRWCTWGNNPVSARLSKTPCFGTLKFYQGLSNEEKYVLRERTHALVHMGGQPNISEIIKTPCFRILKFYQGLSNEEKYVFTWTHTRFGAHGEQPSISNRYFAWKHAWFGAHDEQDFKKLSNYQLYFSTCNFIGNINIGFLKHIFFQNVSFWPTPRRFTEIRPSVSSSSLDRGSCRRK